jgi:hypothetical protein
MNCIANKRTPAPVILALLVVATIGSSALGDEDSMAYTVHYALEPIPESHSIAVSMTVRQSRDLLREVRFKSDHPISNIRIDGSPVDPADEVVWRPKPSGGTLRWEVALGNERGGNGYDAWLTEDWGIFRAEDVIPRAATRAIRGAFSQTSMEFDLPPRWAEVTAYPAEDGRYAINKPYRNFDQPDGWIAIGRLGIRRDTVSNMRVTVAGPVGHSVRRMQMIALLNWTMPELSRAIGDLPERLTIVSASTPMWRGGLSGPNSLYLHADRPIISENSTSPLLHEVMHSFLRMSAAEPFDWIVEGFAEYYSLELLRRSGSISESRYKKAMTFQENWAESAETLCRPSSTGATTALAVTIMAALDREIKERTSGTSSLDNVLAALRERPRGLTLFDVQRTTAGVIGANSVTLQLDNLPGCRSIDAVSSNSS